MAFTTFVRVEDSFGQYDHPKDVALPPGASLVEDYPEYRGLIARPSKAFTDKNGAPSTREHDAYVDQSKAKLTAEAKKRIRAGRDLAVDPDKGTKPALVAALELDDAAQAAEHATTPDTTEVSDTGNPTNTSGAAAGSE